MAIPDDKFLAAIKHSATIGGATAGNVIGFLAGGPIGAAIGGAVGATLQSVAIEVVNRELSRREEIRLGCAASYAIDFIRERLKRGDRIREDKFFVKERSGSSPAEEILEGVLLKAKGDHEERKARFYGVLFANVAFDAGCSQSEANHLLHLMDRLTFLQLTLVSLFSDGSRFPELPLEDYENKPIGPELLAALAAIFELYRDAVLKKVWKMGEEGGDAMFDLAEIVPARMALLPIGKRLFDLAGLSAIGGSNELKRVADLLAKATPGGLVLKDDTGLRHK